jgi:hypothetical protein
MQTQRNQNYEFARFFDGYITCALWSSTDESDESGGEPMDANYGPDDIDDASLQALQSEASDFFSQYYLELDEYAHEYQPAGGYDPWECAGHDFWLTRNGHGAGFWDRGLGELGERLTRASKAYGSCDLYVGDDGKVYAHGYEGE